MLDQISDIVTQSIYINNKKAGATQELLQRDSDFQGLECWALDGVRAIFSHPEKF